MNLDFPRVSGRKRKREKNSWNWYPHHRAIWVRKIGEVIQTLVGYSSDNTPLKVLLSAAIKSQERRISSIKFVDLDVKV